LTIPVRPRKKTKSHCAFAQWPETNMRND
jgi:hypothetical protein